MRRVTIYDANKVVEAYRKNGKNHHSLYTSNEIEFPNEVCGFNEQGNPCIIVNILNCKIVMEDRSAGNEYIFIDKGFSEKIDLLYDKIKSNRRNGMIKG